MSGRRWVLGAAGSLLFVGLLATSFEASAWSVPSAAENMALATSLGTSTPFGSVAPTTSPTYPPFIAVGTPAVATPYAELALPTLAAKSLVPCPPAENLATGPLLTAGGAPLYSNGTRTRRVIAITIDDAFSPSAVLADLAILQKERVNATWFPIGYVAAQNPALWQQVAKAGFPIANHTWDHANLTTYSYNQIVEDISRDNRTLAGIIGEPLLPVVRPMGGSWNETVTRAALAAGEKAVVLWDTTDADTGRNLKDVRLLVAAAEGGRNGSILLMHANLPYAQQALPSIIKFYRSCGFGFVTVGQLLGIPGPVPFPS